MYKILGYYICEKLKTPDWLGIKSDAMISVSSCFGGIHPDLTYCYFINNRKEERIEYQEKWNINPEKAAMLQNDIASLFESRLAIDGRFSKLADAKKICQTYFDMDRCMIVSVSTMGEHYGKITSELMENSNSINDFFAETTDENELLGYDILGWDISGFHTFLCNHLQRELNLAKFNNYCLLENEFEEVENFAKQIQDRGEPVEWVPCRIGRCE